MAYLTYGPYEPAGFAAIRAQYYRNRLPLLNLEVRIGMTDGGLRWLARVKRVGYFRGLPGGAFGPRPPVAAPSIERETR